MQRPHEVLEFPEAGAKHDELIESQAKNLASALAYGALTTPSGVDERRLYESIVHIPHYQSKYLQILDMEDEKKVVENNFARF